MLATHIHTRSRHVFLLFYIFLQHVGSSLNSYLCVAFVSTVSFSHFPPFEKREKRTREEKKFLNRKTEGKHSMIHMDRIAF